MYVFLCLHIWIHTRVSIPIEIFKKARGKGHIYIYNSYSYSIILIV